MCGRYVSPDQAAIEREWHIGRATSNPIPRRFNVAPTNLVPILRLDRKSAEIELTAARWGLIPHWWKDVKLPVHTCRVNPEVADLEANLGRVSSFGKFLQWTGQVLATSRA